MDTAVRAPGRARLFQGVAGASALALVMTWASWWKAEQSRPSGPRDAAVVARLLGDLLQDLNSGDVLAIENLATRSDARDPRADAGLWVAEFGGRSLHDATYLWRTDPDGLRTEVTIAARDSSDTAVLLRLMVVARSSDGETAGTGPAEASITGPLDDFTRIGASLFTVIPDA